MKVKGTVTMVDDEVIQHGAGAQVKFTKLTK
jgi:hypothetical protein